jgi:tripartite-type tricarboxylate transporter receptor subunit TctC
MPVDRLRLGCNALILASALIGTGALAQAFPSKPVRIVLPLAAGSPVEPEARRLAKDFEGRWNQPVIIEHRPGAGTTVGAAAVANSQPDGYTLLFGTGSLPSIKILQPAAPVDPLKDFEYIAIVNEFSSNVLVTNKAFPGSTWAEFVAYAKANPGKVNYGSIGGVQTLTVEAIRRAAGIDIVEVRFAGGATQSVPALLRNDVQLMVSSVGSMRAQAEAGAMKPLLILGDRPAPEMPAAVTTAQLGYSGVRSFSWFALLAPAGTSRQLVDKISADAALFVQSAETRQREAAGERSIRAAGLEAAMSASNSSTPDAGSGAPPSATRTNCRTRGSWPRSLSRRSPRLE